ncbi:hypothetical protein [Blastomonas sp.]|uniref:hypothetical protein n=1 Tax=Blastomonas sp. TaxID=1909299 RepID=UPI00391B1BFA
MVLMFAGVFSVFISIIAVFALLFFAWISFRSEEFHPVAAGLCAGMIMFGIWNTFDSVVLINAPNRRRLKVILIRSALAASPLVFVGLLMWIRA